MAKSIDVSDLNIYYGDFLAVEGVTMTIPARSVTALIGPSGCGKSTFLRSLNRMHEVIPGARVEGTIVIDGQDRAWGAALVLIVIVMALNLVARAIGRTFSPKTAR